VATTYPGARWTPLGAQTEDRLTEHDIICVHTMVGYLTSTDPFFRHYNGDGYDGTESHLGIGGKWGPDLGGNLDGAVWQWQDLDYRADANYEGNHHVISIETADNAARPIQEWTAAEILALVDLIVWLCRRYDIPPTLVPDTQPGRRGLAYHAQGAAEHTVGEWWSTSPTKDCPTASRIAQFRTVVVPRVQRALAGGDDMPLTDTDVQAVDTKVWTHDVAAGDSVLPSWRALANPATGHAATQAALATLARDVAAVKAAVAAQADDETRILAALAPLLDDEAKLTRVVEQAVAGIPGGPAADVEAVKAGVRAVLSEVRLSAPQPS
jgi:hypothetical protein